MKKLKESSHACGPGRAGCAGRWEKTNENYDRDKLRRLKREYAALDPMWRKTFLDGLSRFERKVVTGQIKFDSV